MAMGGSPIYIIQKSAKRDKRKEAQSNNITAARMVADAVKTTLGPRGMDKMLVNTIGEIMVTNDGVTILKEMDVQHPAGKMMVEVARTMDQECGDGTTSSVVLTGELLSKALELMDKHLHQTTIGKGYRMAADKAVEVIEGMAKPVTIKDEKALLDIASTAMNSKAIGGLREQMSGLVVETVRSIAEKQDDKYVVDLENVQFKKRVGGAMKDIQLIKGVILDLEPMHQAMPRKLKKAKIGLVSSALEIKKTEVDASITIDTPLQMQQFLDEDESTLKKMVEQVKASGANVLLVQKAIDDVALHFLAKEGIFALRRVKEEDMKMVALASGATIVNKVSDLEGEDLGYADQVEVRKIEEDIWTYITGCKNPKSVSILIRGGTKHMMDEMERSLIDALNVTRLAIEDGKMVTGGGSWAAEASLRVKDYASSVSGKEQLAVAAFADALEVLPTTLAENAGMNRVDIMIELRKAHQNGHEDAGVNIYERKVGSMKAIDVLEPVRVSRQAIYSATDAAVQILRIDDVVASTADHRPDRGPQGAKGLSQD